MNGLLLIITLGLIFDIIGAWYISRGLIRKTKEEIDIEAGGKYNIHHSNKISLIRQKVECKYGFVFMFIGFLLQIICYVIQAIITEKQYSIITLDSKLFLCLLFIEILLGIAIYILTYRWLCAKSKQKAEKKYI